METINFRVAAFSLVILLSTESSAGWFGPSNQAECILESMKGVTSDRAATLVARSCREKFPDKPKEQKKTRELSSSELGQVTGRAGIDSYITYFKGNLYNGNTSVTVTQVSVGVTTKIDEKEVSRTYVADVNIPPQTTANFSFSIIVGDKVADFSWGLVAARGY